MVYIEHFFQSNLFFKGKKLRKYKEWPHTLSPSHPKSKKIKESHHKQTNYLNLGAVTKLILFHNCFARSAKDRIFPLLKDWRSHRLWSNWCSIRPEAWINIWACKVWCKKVSIMSSLLPKKACGKIAHVLMVSNLVFGHGQSFPQLSKQFIDARIIVTYLRSNKHITQLLKFTEVEDVRSWSVRFAKLQDETKHLNDHKIFNSWFLKKSGKKLTHLLEEVITINVELEKKTNLHTMINNAVVWTLPPSYILHNMFTTWNK